MGMTGINTNSTTMVKQETTHTYNAQQGTWLGVQLQWYAINMSTGREQQRYNISVFTDKTVTQHIPYTLLAINQKGKIDVIIQQSTNATITVEAVAGVFQDGLDPLVWLGVEPSGTSQTITLSYAGKSLNIVPATATVAPNTPTTITTRDIVLYNSVRGIVKDATVIFKFRFKQGNNVIGEANVRFTIVSVADNEPLAIGGPYMAASGATHISVVEGVFASFVLNAYSALSNLLNRLAQQDVLSMLTSRFDAQILGFVAVTAKNGRGETIPKLIVYLKEASPIAPIAVIIAILAGIALIFGIIFATGYMMQSMANLNISQAIQSAVTEQNKLASTIINDPNLTSEQKQQLLESLNNYYNRMTENIDRTITTIRNTEPLPIAGIGTPILNMLAPLLVVGVMALMMNFFDDLDFNK